MEILHFKALGIHKVSRMEFGCLSSHCHFWYVSSDILPLYQILKQSDNWFYGDIAFKRFEGYIRCRHECSCSRAQRMSNQRTSGGYLPSYKVVLQCIGNLQCYAILISSRTDIHTQTNIHPQYNSFATASRLDKQ